MEIILVEIHAFRLSGAHRKNFTHPVSYHNFGDSLLGSVDAVVVILGLLLLFDREKLIFYQSAFSLVVTLTHFTTFLATS